MTLPRDPEPTGEPLDHESCLAVFSLLQDGRPVDPELEQRARAYAQAHPEVAAAAADLALLSEVLRSEPVAAPGADFTDRVMARASSAGETVAHDAPTEAGDARAPILPMVRRTAAAAALALISTFGYDLARPASLVADESTEAQRHVVDHFRSDATAADDIDAGLRAYFGLDEMRRTPRPAEDGR